jgi:hypothetical protein
MLRSRRPLLALPLFLLVRCGDVSPASQAAPAGGQPPVTNTGPDACAGLIQDRSAKPMSPLAKPALGQALPDPDLGGIVRRITAVPPSEGENAVVKPMYATVQAWNADESRLILWHRGKGHELYDGRSYAFLRQLPLVSPTNPEHVLWDPVDPDVLYYPSNYNAVPNLMRYRVSSNANDLLLRVDACPVDWGKTLSLGSDPGYMSWGSPSKLIGLQCGEQKFLYDVGSKAVVARASLASRNAFWPAPSGLFAYLDGRVYDRGLNNLRALNLANPVEHASLGRSATGHDVYVAVAYDKPAGGSEAADIGSLVVHDLETGQRRVVVGPATGFPYPPSGTFVSAVAHKQPGWVAVSGVGHAEGTLVLDQELLVANVDTGQVCRVAHHRSYAREGRWDYWSEPHAVISPTGTRVLFASDWGNGNSVDSYVVELPGYGRK